MATTLSTLNQQEPLPPTTTIETTPKAMDIDAKTENADNTGSNSATIDGASDFNDDKHVKDNGNTAIEAVKESDKGAVMMRCVGRTNRLVTWGASSWQGRRQTMEDNVRLFPGLLHLTCNEFGGCTAPECKFAAVKSPVHYFGLFDGHGGNQVSKYCANELHLMVAEEWGREAGNDGWHRRWEAALCRSYERADDVFKDNSLAPYSVGTTALVAILSPCQIIASNCGDSRVVLSRGKQAIPLTVDHKLDREDEVARITNGGGQIINWGGLRVGGILNMTRAIGDHDLKPWVIAEPEVTFMTRSEDDEFLILASDGLWDVMSSDDAVKLACYELRRRRRLPEKGDTPSSPACGAAEELVKIAYDAFSTDNISVVIVDLKAPRIRSLQNTEKRDEKQM